MRWVALGGTLVAIIGCCGCGGNSLIQTPAGRAYLERLRVEQAKLAASERRIPTRASSPAALARSISLLAAAIRRLAGDLAMIRAPGPVSSLHARLVAITRSYSSQLSAAARTARAPAGEARAGSALVSATSYASGAFGATVKEITKRMVQSR